MNISSVSPYQVSLLVWLKIKTLDGGVIMINTEFKELKPR